MNKWIFILPLFLLILFACKDRPKQTRVQKENAETTARTVPTTVPANITDSVLLDTAANVKGYETDKYILPVQVAGNYHVVVSSKNLGLIFVIQDAEGNNVTDETNAWSGELKKGNYILIVGLMRNAARRNEADKVDYSVRVVRK